MSQQTIIWTALPDGVARVRAGGTRRLKLSVFVSPRLSDGTTLADFADFLHWPDSLAKIKFSVHLAGATLSEAGHTITRLTPAPDPALWAALFPNKTPVRSYSFDNYAGQRILSYPASTINNFIKLQYQKVGVWPGYPTVRNLLLQDSLLGLVQTRQTIGALAKGAEALFENRFQAPAVAHAAPPVAFYLLSAFHTPPRRAPGGRPGPPPEQIDFHQMVSALGEYPLLLRKLGLVVDLELDHPGLIPANATVSVEAAWTPVVATTPVTPKTLLDETGRFLAKPKVIVGPDGSYPSPGNSEATDLSGGLLRLRRPYYDVIQMDVDGAGIKLAQFAQNLLRSALHQTEDTPFAAPVPSLRSGGLSVARSGRALKMGQTLQTAASYNNSITGNDISLFADDLTRGFRVDVREVNIKTGAHGPWQSLCQRKEVYQFAGTTQTVTSDSEEGIVSTAISTPPPGEEGPLRLHESIFRWAGWSLCVPAPVAPSASGGARPPTVRFPGPEPHLSTGSTTELRFRRRLANGAPWSLQASFSLAGKLPALRFGRYYQFRLRAVDLAGNSLSPEDPEDAEASRPEEGYYSRFEPVSAPAIIPLADLKASAGESVERLVIRSNWDTTTFTRLAQRHIAPPKLSTQMVETHGMFELNAAAREAAPALIAARGDGAFHTYEPGPLTSVPYLPDPLAFGAVLTGLPQEALLRTTFLPPGTAWSDAKPFLLSLAGVKAGAATPLPARSTPAGEEVVQVSVPQARVVRLALASYFANDQSLELMGIWRWIEDWFANPPAGPAPAQSQPLETLRKLALAGLHWMLTPFREIVLVHAVQQPLVSPAITHLTPEKRLAATYVQFDGAITCDASSTIKLELFAQWQEPVDNTDDPKNRPDKDVRNGKAHAFEIPLHFRPEDDPTSLWTDKRSQENPDLRLAVHAASETKAAANTGTPAPDDTLLAVYRPRQQQLEFTVAGAAAAIRSKVFRHDFGDTRRRRVDYYAVAASRFQEYFQPVAQDGAVRMERRIVPHPVFPGGIGEVRLPGAHLTGMPKTTRGDGDEIKTFTTDIPSSARPDAPIPLYVIPTFGWRKVGGTSMRRGGGLRIYLQRPWFSSGEGELLAVVLLNGTAASSPVSNTEVPNSARPYVTQWGSDPIWASKELHGVPTPAAFKAAIHDPGGATTTLALDELSDTAVSVAPHAVAYDPGRQLWYCDVDVDTGGSYFPFIRLALARYQPVSVPGVELSRVVLADFVQLAPDRTASITPAGANQVAVTVTGPGHTGAGNLSNVLTVSAEEQLHSPASSLRIASDELTWLPVDNSEVQLQPVGGETGAWSGKVTVPPTPSGGRGRLVVKEWELFTPGVAGAQPDRRLVYADVLDVPPHG